MAEEPDRIAAYRAPLLDLEIGTERLHLRSLAGADAVAIAGHLADIEVTRWLARVPHPYGLADAVAFVEQARLSAAAGTALTVGLAPRDGDGSVIGIAVIHGLAGQPEFGYWLARDWWGRRLMSEAAGAVLAFARGNLAIRRVHSGAFVGNDASLAIQRRLGFVVTGTSHRLCLAERRMKEHLDTALEMAGQSAR
jgi:RimJ/RimL family protein N-acetyltransferase